MNLTPEGLPILSRDPDSESIVVEWYDGTTVSVANIAESHESRDRYAVTIRGRVYTTELLAPQSAGPSWSSDPLGSAADAACSFANADGAL